jgi:ABC-type Fe3+-citrate transport system substrate-binding protein
MIPLLVGNAIFGFYDFRVLAFVYAGFALSTFAGRIAGVPVMTSTHVPYDKDSVTIVNAKPDVLFVACCGFRTERALEDVREISNTNAWQQLPAVRNGRVYAADGNAYFSCPGPRLIDGLEIMAHALHPDVHPPLHGLAQIA